MRQIAGSEAIAERGTVSDERESRAQSRVAARFSLSAQRSGLHSFRPSLITHRSAFTLIELMVTILIISILAGLFLGALSRAQTQANIAHTQSLIAKLNSQLMLRYESYRTRRLPINTSSLSAAIDAYNFANPTNQVSPQRAAAVYRLAALRELVRMELPDRYSDLTAASTVASYFTYDSANNQWWPGPIGGPPVVIPPTATNLSYQRRCNNNGVGFPSAQFEDAECLYLIITSGLSDNTMAGEHISPNDIGDADGDGMPEFHDAWGNPIHYIRWAPGFVSDVQPSPPDVVARHDPFDPLKLQGNAFALYPLIYSAGPDGAGDLLHPLWNPNSATNSIQPPQAFSLPSSSSTLTWQYYVPNLNQHVYDPYGPINSNFALVGGPADDNGDGDSTGWTDNIHNQLIGQ
jgi:prepilin-type N-terminal cleavage/methylation domain-containing protein